MRHFTLAWVALCLLIVPGCQHAANVEVYTSSEEAELRRIDLDQSRFTQAADEQAMSALLHPAYTAHLPNGKLVDRSQTLALIKSGASAKERYQRTHERVIIAGTTGVVVGVDRLEAPPSLAQHGERTRRYTNVYTRQNGRWQLLARHFNLLP